MPFFMKQHCLKIHLQAPNNNSQPTSKIMLLVHHVNDKSSSLSEDKCMGVFRPGLYLVFKEGAAPPPARNLKI